MQPIIGITAGEVQNYNFPYLPATQGQRYTYVDAIMRAGGTPIIIPIIQNDTVLRQLYDMCDGLLLAGGNDIDPTFYGGSPQTATNPTEITSPKRDSYELRLTEWALADNKPLLGICRGMQLLNIQLGGTLYRDIQSDIPNGKNHDISGSVEEVIKKVHQLRIEPNSKFAAIVGKHPLGANSQHHQAIKDLGDGLIATAWAEDDTIEAIELPNKGYALGVQSHPESMEESVELRWRELFSSFVDAAAIQQ